MRYYYCSRHLVLKPCHLLAELSEHCQIYVICKDCSIQRIAFGSLIVFVTIEELLMFSV